MNPLGIYRLAVMRSEGIAMEKNKQQALELFKKALPGLQKLSDDPYALAAVAHIISEQGSDPKQILSLYMKAAENGYAPAQLKCAEITRSSNPEEAERYSKMAIDQGLQPLISGN
jgi:TPR repeat protein